MSTLYIVATPIGNMQDITLRALQVLKDVDVIACEDTRNTKRLLDYHSILQKKLISCNAINEEKSKLGIKKLLDEGQNVAYVSDAGTPCISDPGARIVDLIQNTEHKIVPIPGANAAVSGLSVAGNIGKNWLFEGFLAKTDGKLTKRLNYLLELNITFVIYESPFRIIKLLEKLNMLAPTRKIMVAREITKMYEETLTGTAQELLDIFGKRQSIKGEFCIIVYYEKDDKKDND